MPTSDEITHGNEEPDATRVRHTSQANTPNDFPTLHHLSGAASAFELPLEPGEMGVFGDYRIVRVLGKGGMGTVYLAHDQRHRRDVALKLMRPEFAAHTDVKARFLREARLNAQVQHNNVVLVYTSGEWRGVPYIAMQYLRGDTLDTHLQNNGGRLQPAEVLEIARQVAAGLAAAHENGLVHRDVKPANLMRDSSGCVKLLDFGLARPVDGHTQLTQNHVMGTPAYMAPEQANGQSVDHRTDLFGLGAVLYHLCTGRTPFAGGSVMEMFSALATKEPPRVRVLNPAVPEALGELIHHLLQKNPAHRPQSAREVISAIGAVLAAPVQAPPPAAGAPRALRETVPLPPPVAPVVAPSGTLPAVEVPGYELLDTLGSGENSVVYRARHEKLGREVALKTVFVTDDAPEARARFEQDAHALAKLRHPNIVSVFDTGPCARPEGFAYVTMELLQGDSLDAVIERGPLPEARAWLLAGQVAAALSEADAHGIVHRNVKPTNLFIEPVPRGIALPADVGLVKVTGFSLALVYGVGIGVEADGRVSFAVGTPVYMAPEQFRGGAVDRRADIYALGATVFHARTGRVPFDGRSASELARQKELEPPALPNGSPEEVALLKRIMARDPADRPQTYDELLSAIHALPCMEPWAAVKMVAVPVLVPPEPPDLRTRALQLLGVLAIGLALGALATWLTGGFGK